jgi:hypothetical protein
MNPGGTLDDDGAWTTSHAHPHSHMTAHRHKASSCRSLLINTTATNTSVKKIKHPSYKTKGKQTTSPALRLCRAEKYFCRVSECDPENIFLIFKFSYLLFFKHTH